MYNIVLFLQNNNKEEVNSKRIFLPEQLTNDYLPESSYKDKENSSENPYKRSLSDNANISPVRNK